jgi:hypothetical protein
VKYLLFIRETKYCTIVFSETEKNAGTRRLLVYLFLALRFNFLNS